MVTIPLKTIHEMLPQLTVQGQDSDHLEVDRISSFQKAGPNSLVFVLQAKFLPAALNCPASYVLTSREIWQEDERKTDKVVLLHPNPNWAVATLARHLFARDLADATWWEGAIHPQAIIAPSAQVSPLCHIGPGAVIGPNVVLADNVFVGAGAVIEEGTRIGRDTIIHPQSFIGHHCEIGAECVIHPHTTIGTDGFGFATNERGEHCRIPHLGRVVLGDRVEVGSNCTIDRGRVDDSTIGAGTKIDNLCHFGHNFICGRNCLFTAHFVAAGSVTIGNNFVCGGRTSVAGHKTITDNVHVAGHSAISNHITKPGQYGGHPLQPLQDHLRTVASLAHVPAMRKQLSQLLKKVLS